MHCERHFSSRLPLAVEAGSTPWLLVQTKTWRDSLRIDMLLSAVSILVVAQSSSEIPEGLMNNPIYSYLLCKSLTFLLTTFTVREKRAGIPQSV